MGTKFKRPEEHLPERPGRRHAEADEYSEQPNDERIEDMNNIFTNQNRKIVIKSMHHEMQHKLKKAP